MEVNTDNTQDIRNGLKTNSIELPIEIVSRNKIDKMHWSKKAKLRDTYQLLVRNQMTLNKITKVDDGQKCGLVLIGYRKRSLDFDNFVGGCKQLIDALSREGFIWDDNMKYLGIPTFIQEKCEDTEPYVAITRSIIK